jgi:hypothetical protein
MSFLTPLAFLFGLLALPIIVLYMLKMRRREVQVPSILLWQRLLRDREANAPWQKLKRNLLLILQLLLLAALMFALVRPFIEVPAVARGSVIVLLDASASMQATDVSPSRFDVARAAVGQLIDGLGSDDDMTLILVGQQPEVLAANTRDAAVLRGALAGARPEQGPADWEAAFALARGAARAATVTQIMTVIVSDGGLPDAGLPGLPGDVRYIPIGVDSANLAVEALALRATEGGPQLYARVANLGPNDATATLSLLVGDALLRAETVSAAPGAAVDVVVSGLPEEAAVYRAVLTGPNGDRPDAFALDDQAWAVFQPPSAGRVLVFTSGNVFLEQILTAIPGLQPFRAAPSAPLPNERFDLYVTDSLTTEIAPAGADLLIINPITSTLFEVGGVFTNTALRSVAQTDPLARYLDWREVNVREARQVVAPPWARVLVQAEGGPLVFAGEVGGRRVAVITFRLQDSDLPLKLDFPVLMSNLLEYLAPAQPFSAPDGLRPGETLLIRAGGREDVAVIDPGGTVYAAQATEAGVVFADTHRLGVYTVGGQDRELGRFAVNLFVATESRIAPRPTLTIGATQITAGDANEVGQLEIWPWLALLAFIVLVIEWYVYQRGTNLPKLASPRPKEVRTP